MILQGSQRGGARDLARHLLKKENEHIEVYELRGFASDDLKSALDELHAISRGTRAKQFLFSLSLNPPPTANVSTDQFLSAINKVEERLGLNDQPRAIVFHEKNDRRHCHVVWSRIDADEMKAIPLPHTRLKLKDMSRELYIENGWKMPEGYANSNARNPLNFTMAEWQQAKRVGKDPRHIKAAFQDAWAISDTQETFQDALKERGFTLAKGDRRSFVALDHACEVYAVPKWTGLKTKDVRARLKDEQPLPSVDEAKTAIAKDMQERLQEMAVKQTDAINTRAAEIERARNELVKKQTLEREQLRNAQEKRLQEEILEKQKRLRKGFGGLWDRVTGQRSRIIKRNELESWQAVQRDQQERDKLVFSQIEQRRGLTGRLERLKGFEQKRNTELKNDLQQYREIGARRREKFELSKSGKTRGRDDEPTHEH